ncbi:MAG TPA: prolyl oligopeptidase family serine peptidase [Candidatus Acidoferrales bacterium]|nr:prolyl oligopeptidase family serine peptidase [Candidatus Acidoferrales bacterium]
MKYWLAIALSPILALAGCAGRQPATGRGLTIGQAIQIKFPSDPGWSPDGSHIAFLWDEGGVHSLYVVAASGQAPPLKLMSYPWSEVSGGGTVPPPFWSHDGSTLYYPSNGQLWQVAAAGGSPRPAWNAAGREGGFALSPDGTRVAFVRAAGKGPGQGSDLIVRSLAGGAEIRAAHDPYSVRGIVWSPDGAHLAYTAGSQVIPHNDVPPYVGRKLIFVATEVTPGRLFVVPSAGGRPVAAGMGGEQGVRWIDRTHLVFAVEPTPYKIRTIYLAGVTGGAPKMIHQDVEDKFWSMPYGANDGPQPSPDGRWIAYLSDTDGWDHLYVMPAGGGAPVKITDGDFESWRPVWSHDSTRIAFDANAPGKPGDRQLGIATIGNDPAHAVIRYITQGDGTNIAPEWSPDDSAIAYQHADSSHSADLFTIPAAGGSAARLTESMPAGIDPSLFVAPQLIHYPGAHGEMVPAWLFVPKGLDRSKKHAAIIWVHGDGVNQNYDGWHVQQHYATYYSFHQVLLQEGYVVIAPDYRGSIGYGRQWRTGVYNSVGVDDADDAWMAANYLKTLPYVDPERIGIWGLSYGGFFTLIAVTKQPTLFRAAVDVAGVVSYDMYYEDPYHGGWTVSRMNGGPEQNPAAYANARPIDHMDRLERPLLILAGTADVNVPFVETVALVDRLLALGKGPLFSFRMYPGEFHYFDRAYVLEDAWRHVDRFFREHLHPSETD